METLRSCREAEEANETPEVEPPVPPVPQDRNRVRLMTIHQAKGLEFPVVVLGGVGARPRSDRATDTGFMEDWAKNRRGAAITAKLSRVALSTLAGAFIRLERMERSEEESGRLMYVALTRAKDLLMVMKPMNEVKAGWSIPAYLDDLAGELTGTSLVARGESAPPFRAVKRGAGPGPVAAAVPEYPPAVAEPELVTPSGLAAAEQSAYADDRWQGRPGSQSFDLLLGEVCHRVLERWDYGAPVDGLAGALENAVDALDLHRVDRGLLTGKAGDLLKGFLGSGAAAELARARILGREVPILAGVGGKAVNARADVVYELGGKLFVGDYKTGSDPKVSPAVARAYAGAATAALGREASFRIISLAKGTIGG
jgi:ATP-dependent helicase/nuclease subunit A